MTVADNTSRNQYTATSGQTVFAYTFEIVDKGDIVVLKNGTTLSEGTNYTVSNVGNDSGGNVTLTVGATTGDILTLYRDMPYARTQNYTNSGDFLASEVNSDFDNLWLAGEQTNRSFSQSIRKPITDSDSISMELPAAASRTNSFLTFDSTGAVSTSPLSSALSPSIIVRQQFTGNGSTAVFTLSADPGSPAGVVIYIDGVYQEEGTYSVSGSTVTFTEAPPTNASIEVVSYKTTAVGTTDANSVTYLPAGTGAVQTTVQTKLRESVSVKDFGAVGDGVTDDTAAIQAALDSLSEGQTLIFSDSTYKIESAIIIPFVDDITINLNGATIEIDGGYSAFGSTQTVVTTISITDLDIVRNRFFFQCDSAGDAANFSSGDLIQIRTTTAWYQDDRGSAFKGELHEVDKVDGRTVYVKGTTQDTYDTATETITVVKFNSANGFTLKNGIIYNNRSSSGAGGINIKCMKHGQIENIFSNNSLNGIFFDLCFNMYINNCRVEKANASGTGYGMQATDCAAVEFNSNYFYGCRRGIDISGEFPSHNCVVRNNICDGGGFDDTGSAFSDQSGFGSHSPAVGTVFENNIVRGCRDGFLSRGFNEIYQNNVMYAGPGSGSGSRYFIASTFGSNIVVDGNKFISNEFEGITSSGSDVTSRLEAFVFKYLRDEMGQVTITNNIADRVEQSFIRLENQETSGDAFDQFDVSNNVIRFFGGSSSEGGSNQVFLIENNDTPTTFEFEKSRFLNNLVGKIEAGSGYKIANSGITFNTDHSGGSCLIDNLPLSFATDVPAISAVSGTVSSTSLSLYADILPGRTHIYGNIEVTTSTAQVQITNMPGFNFGEIIRTPTPSAIEEVWAVYTGNFGNIRKLFFTDDITTSLSALTDGAHEMHLDLTYKNNLLGFF